jgi:hypothetical protein
VGRARLSNPVGWTGSKFLKLCCAFGFCWWSKVDLKKLQIIL